MVHGGNCASASGTRMLECGCGWRHLTADAAECEALQLGLSLVPSLGKTRFKGVYHSTTSPFHPYRCYFNGQTWYFATAQQAALEYARHLGPMESARQAAMPPRRRAIQCEQQMAVWTSTCQTLPERFSGFDSGALRDAGQPDGVYPVDKAATRPSIASAAAVAVHARRRAASNALANAAPASVDSTDGTPATLTTATTGPIIAAAPLAIATTQNPPDKQTIQQMTPGDIDRAVLDDDLELVADSTKSSGFTNVACVKVKSGFKYKAYCTRGKRKRIGSFDNARQAALAVAYYIKYGLQEQAQEEQSLCVPR